MDKKTSGKGERRKEKKMCCKKALGMHVYKRGAHVCAHSHEKKKSSRNRITPTLNHKGQ